MKSIPAQLAVILGHRTAQRNVRVLGGFLAILVGMVCIYAVLFHVIMEMEGRQFSWVSGFFDVDTQVSDGVQELPFAAGPNRAFTS